MKIVDITYNASWTSNTSFSIQFRIPFEEKTNYFNMKVREKLFIRIALKTLYKSTRKIRSWIFDKCTYDLCISWNSDYHAIGT